VIDAETRPRLAAKARLRYDRQGQRYLLLYPERGLALNGTAVDVVKLCTGEHTVAGIVTVLTDKYTDKPRDVVEREVLSFLASLADRGLVQDAP
jgi:coenzyme PQQ biosynthesis protein PqqD